VNAITPPTPENVAEFLSEGGNVLYDGRAWFPAFKAVGNVVEIEIAPINEDGNGLNEVHFRAVVVEGDQTPIVVVRPDIAEIQGRYDAPHDALACGRDCWRLAHKDVPALLRDNARLREELATRETGGAS
jgi:hypothetical protein